MDIPLEKKRFSKKRIGIAVGIILLISLITFVVVSTGGKSKLNVDVERISINEIKAGVFQENIPVSGNVMPITTIYLDALEGGGGGLLNIS